ncbi:ABC transporter ATP-binding protein, partial [Streptomyces sp. Wh19]|nr:ABC transporter ATP-binding protein [Streptomyces sp. Wh19]
VALESCASEDQELRDAGPLRRAACVLVGPGAAAVPALPGAEEARSTP